MASPGDLLTAPGQLQYGRLLMGRHTPYRWRALTGWGALPALDSGTVPRPAAHGAIPGQFFAQVRTVGVEGLVVRAPRSRIGEVVETLEAATVPVDDEQPLAVWLDERGPRLVWARCTRRALPVEAGYGLGTILGGAIEWEASDPRRYGLVEHTATATLPAPEPGLAFPLAFPLSFGAPGSTGAMTVHNGGNSATHPVIEIRGPVDLPSITNTTTGDILEYDLPLAAGDVLAIDTRAGAVTLNGHASRLYTATARSAPENTFTLPPGASTLLYRAAPGSADPAASATVRYRAAYW
ncbi:hypothetical protein BJP40_08325 [Streptomyces sp. CC53]|uniref:phage distal tail protein n=1 Tax=Streptomyces sp. CC53 TaxID=1906740 RepID=UPI0008DE0DE8|nr:phage tail domain-containing protein [Streptomyces sp. CC53]OII60859.1 hypothetical protein BJP40_08325 [Streptomyces sp. CC53]